MQIKSNQNCKPANRRYKLIRPKWALSIRINKQTHKVAPKVFVDSVALERVEMGDSCKNLCCLGGEFNFEWLFWWLIRCLPAKVNFVACWLESVWLCQNPFAFAPEPDLSSVMRFCECIKRNRRMPLVELINICIILKRTSSLPMCN